MLCDRCGVNVPEFLWEGRDHPVLTNHPTTIRRTELGNNEYKITVHAYVGFRMCSEMHVLTDEDINDPLFLKVWSAIKDWDIQRYPDSGYAHATGTDVMTIIRAIKSVR